MLSFSFSSLESLSILRPRHHFFARTTSTAERDRPQLLRGLRVERAFRHKAVSEEAFEFRTDVRVEFFEGKESIAQKINRYERRSALQAHSLSRFTNQELNHKIQFFVREERRATVEVLRLLREIERRMVYAELGYPSLFAYCTGQLGYSEAAASRRIEAMRAMREIVEIEKKIESGELSLSAVSQARVAIRAHERETKVEVSIEQTKSVILQLSGLSKRAAEKVLVRERPVTLSAHPIPEKHLATGGTRLTLDLTQEEMSVIEDLRRLQSKTQNTKDLLLNIARKELAKKKRELGEAPPIRESKQTAKAITAPAEEKLSMAKETGRFSVSIKRLAWRKAESQCEFVSALGRRCEARHYLEFDHRTPLALGGEGSVQNARVLCREHNVFQAVQKLGTPVMAPYLPRLES